MLNFIDNFLNRITMYRLVLYYLIILVVVATLFSIFEILSYDPIDVLSTTIALMTASWVINKFFSWAFAVPTNVESVYISSLILSLIITPGSSLFFISIAAIVSQASKYLLVWRAKHIFNPAAFAVLVTAGLINQGASWWVGTIELLPIVAIGGLLVVRKIKRFDMVASFFFFAVASIIYTNQSSTSVFEIVKQLLLYSPLAFFALVMLVEPTTTPPGKLHRMIYASLVGLIFTMPIHFGAFYPTFEFALILGNIFSFIVSPKGRYKLILKSKRLVSQDTYDFTFKRPESFSFQPGQYMEWTLDTKKSDSRGNRRYFTIASSPTEPEIHLGTKFSSNSSTFKQTLISLPTDSMITASQLAGDFTLPKDPNQRLVFIAGGIGITPFRSMIKYLLDRKEKRQIVLLFSNRTAADVAYEDILEEARNHLNLKIVYTLTDASQIPANWQGRTGYVNAEMIHGEIPDFRKCLFYISGSRSMVEEMKKVLKNIGVKQGQIKIDFFPGYV